MKSRYSLKQRFVLLLSSTVAPIFLLMFGFTWKLKWKGLEELERARELSPKVLFAFWHSGLLGLCYAFRFRNAGIMVSKSFDGEWITRLATKLGYRVFRGSASRDGAKGLLEMVKDKLKGDLALTVDGPKGPPEKVKHGIVALAANTGLPIVPLTIIVDRAWRLKSWDRFIVPKPFSKVTVLCGPHIKVPADIAREDLSKCAIAIEEAITKLG